MGVASIVGTFQKHSFSTSMIMGQRVKSRRFVSKLELTYPTKREKEDHHRLKYAFAMDMLVSRKVYYPSQS